MGGEVSLVSNDQHLKKKKQGRVEQKTLEYMAL